MQLTGNIWCLHEEHSRLVHKATSSGMEKQSVPSRKIVPEKVRMLSCPAIRTNWVVWYVAYQVTPMTIRSAVMRQVREAMVTKERSAGTT